MAFGPIEMSVGHMDQDLSGRGIVLRHGLPSSLESLSLFEDISSKSPEVEEVGEVYGTDAFRSSSIQVLDGLAGRAVNLKHLSVSFLSDAMNCFKFPAGALPNLQSLAITSQEHLQPNDWKVRRILLDAATAVTKLPKLQIMELWNCEKGHAAILRYEAAETVRSRTCELTWRSSWYSTKSTIGAEVIEAWEHAAHESSRQLTFVLDPLPPAPYSHYGAILRHLKLRDYILDPVTAMQVRVGIDEEDQPEVPVWRASVPYSPLRDQQVT
ncbi:hypothetical protein FJTKL_14845 [Diaporthe vaccinii]|uniref:DUF6546 domain-containing protein n=1 Tax=Diaporthe vaccinii TaxID=105482 RepID=A0ABR4F8R1_9PEZI